MQIDITVSDIIDECVEECYKCCGAGVIWKTTKKGEEFDRGRKCPQCEGRKWTLNSKGIELFETLQNYKGPIL